MTPGGLYTIFDRFVNYCVITVITAFSGVLGAKKQKMIKIIENLTKFVLN